MEGVLPIKLKYIQADSDKVRDRFYHACIGWIRYKPLLIYITQREEYEEKIKEMRANLKATLPQICKFFNRTHILSSKYKNYSK